MNKTKAWNMAINGKYKRPKLFICKRCKKKSQSKRGQDAKLCGICQTELMEFGYPWEKIGERNVDYVERYRR